MMVRSALAVLCLAFATPLAAEDWHILGVLGESPVRSIVLLDRDAIDRRESQRPIIRNATLLESKQDSGVWQIVVSQQIDCQAGTVRRLGVEGRDADGAVIVTDGEGEIEQIEADTVVDLFREAACEDRWDSFLQSAGDKSLGLIAAETFGWYYE